MKRFLSILGLLIVGVALLTAPQAARADDPYPCPDCDCTPWDGGML
jgi:hypothetical protein